jgi:hypothetical protein
MLVKGVFTVMNHGNRHGSLPSTGKTFVFATERVNSVQAAGASGSTFYLSENINDPRESPYYIACSDLTPAELATASNLSWSSNLLYLEIFTDNDPTKAIIERYINVNSIAIAWEYELDSDYCWLRYFEGGFRKKDVLCAFNLDALLNYADTGTTTA